MPQKGYGTDQRPATSVNVYMGEYQPKKGPRGSTGVPHGDPMPNYYPAVVDEQTFYAALGTIKKRTKRAGRGGGKRENILSGLVYNAEDGYKMYYSTNPKGAFLQTTSGYYGSAAPVGRSFPYQPVEFAVLSILSELKVDSDGAERVGSEDIVASLEGRLADINSRIQKLSATAAKTDNFDALLECSRGLSSGEEEINRGVGTGQSGRSG